MINFNIKNNDPEFKDNFWEDFNMPKTLSNVLKHFIQNYHHSVKKPQLDFIYEIIQNYIIQRPVDQRKLKELVDIELSKIDINKITIPTNHVYNQNKESNIKNQNIEKSDKNHLSIFQADSLGGDSFQDFVAEILQENGFTDVEIIGKSGDQGGDLIAITDDKKIIIQAKRYSIDKKISNSAVQEVLGAIRYYDADIGAVITNTVYTKPAKELAKKAGITLWNRTDLTKFIENYNKSHVQSKNRVPSKTNKSNNKQDKTSEINKSFNQTPIGTRMPPS